MLYSINTGYGVPGHVSPSAREAPKATPDRKEPNPVSEASSVHLSIADQARVLRQEGELDLQIAAKLNLSTREVDGDRDITLVWPEALARVAPSGASPLHMKTSEEAVHSIPHPPQ